MSDMKNTRVLVTGAGTGIGRGIALEFARQGAAVALHYSRSSKGLTIEPLPCTPKYRGPL